MLDYVNTLGSDNSVFIVEYVDCRISHEFYVADALRAPAVREAIDCSDGCCVGCENQCFSVVCGGKLTDEGNYSFVKLTDRFSVGAAGI